MVVRSPPQENDPADAHPSTLKSVLESANPRMDTESPWFVPGGGGWDKNVRKM